MRRFAPQFQLSATSVPADAHLGFTAWVMLKPRVTPSKVAAFTHRLDGYLARQGLNRSIYPLHMLLWSPSRSLNCDDQIRLVAWVHQHGGVESIAVGALQTHMCIPARLDQVPQVHVQLDERHIPHLLRLHAQQTLRPEEVVRALGGYVAPATLH